MKLASYWLDTAEPFRNGTPGPIEGEVDAAIVGAGFTGLSAALALAKRGAGVAVLDAGPVGGGASGRNGGHVNNGLSLDFRGVAKRHGLERARAFYRAFDAGVDLVERLVREEGIACGFRRTGKIKLAAKPAHFEALARTYDVMVREVDPDMALVPGDRIRDEVGSDAYYGGLVFGKSAQMHMGRFAVGLAEAAVRRGVLVYEHAPVTALRRTGSGLHELATRRGVLRARKVLLATGVSGTGPFSYFRRRIVPVGSFIIATEPLPRPLLDELMPTRRNATTTRHVGHYFRIADDRLIFGGRARFAASNPRSDVRSGHILEGDLLRSFPQLKGTRVEYCWGGLVDMTVDRLPRAGEREGAFYALGYSGHGTQMAVSMGTAMAEVMAGSPMANPWRDLPWPAIPGHFGPPWFLPIVGAYYRLKDALS